MCGYRNRFPLIPSPGIDYLIQIHQNQKREYQEAEIKSTADVSNHELNEKAPETRIRFLQSKYGVCLEIGCESGWFIDAMLSAGKILKGYGIDIRRNEFKIPSSANKYLLNASADALPFKKMKFDLIVAFHVIEHITQMEVMRKELARVANGETHVLVALPLGYDDDPCHRWHFMTSGGWERFLNKKLGLDLVTGGVFKTNITEYIGLFSLNGKLP